MTDGLPPPVRDFILAYVDSIETLEMLLLLASEPREAFTAQTMSDRLRTSPSSAKNRLADLTKRGLVERHEGDSYRLRPTPELTATLAQVAGAYRQMPVTMVKLIYSRPSELVRVFSDAFVVGGRKKDG